MAIDTLPLAGAAWRQRSISASAARSVSGDVVGVTSLASTNPLGVNPQIGSGKRMTSVTPGFPGLGVSPVPNLIELILGRGSVDEVSRSVVERVAVVMPDFKTFGSRAVEDQSDDLVDLEAPFATVITVESDARVALVVDLMLQDAAPASGTLQPQNLPSGIGAVVTESLNEDPRFVGGINHVMNSTPNNSLVEGGVV